LKIIYKINTYSKNKFVSASQVGNILYTNKYHNITDIKTFDNFKRKIRTIFNKLEQAKYIKIENKKYSINTNYERNMFD